MAIPASPTNVVVSSITSTTATISWDQSIEATGYNVYDKDDNVVTNLTGIESTSYDLINLLALTAYAYKVSAINNDGESDKVVVTFCTLETPTENISLSNMEIGDYIPCRYTATSGIAGSFSELGTCEADEIPVSGTDTPDGKFNFVKVAKGTLVADRVVQTNIKWDTLNKAKYIEGGLKLFIGKLTDPTQLPSNSGYGVAFSPDGVYMAVAHSNFPYITIYKRDGDTFTKLDNPSNLPSSTGQSVSFSPDGIHLVIAYYDSPYITIYKRDGDTFTKLVNPSVLPTGNSHGTTFSPDGTYLAVAHDTSPYITIYKRDGDTFTKLDDPNVLPTTKYGSKVAFSPDGVYLAVAHNGSPYITIYKRDGDTFTKLADPDVLPTGNAYGVTFSSDGVYMAVGHFNSPYITIYKRDGDTFTKLDNLNVLPAGNGRETTFSPDGVYLAVAHNYFPYITIYKRDGDTFTKLDNPSGGLPIGEGFGVSFSSDGTYLAVAHNNLPYITIYKLSSEHFIRSLSGGNSYLSATQTSSTTDASLGSFPPNNEYDQYIQLSTLDNKITAGDNSVWNYSGISSWVQETPITTIGSSSNRVYRGNTLLGFGQQASSTANATTGFRPVLIYDEDE